MNGLRNALVSFFSRVPPGVEEVSFRNFLGRSLISNSFMLEASTSLPLQDRVSLYPFRQIRTHSWSCNHAPSLFYRREALHSRCLFNGHHHLYSMQNRTLSQLPTLIQPKHDDRKDIIARMKECAKRIGWVRFFIGIAVVTGLYIALQETPPKPNSSEDLFGEEAIKRQPKKVQKALQFVEEFNNAKGQIGDTDDILPLQDRAFDFILDLRGIGGLSPRMPLNVDETMAKKGFLALARCNDVKIQREALRHLQILLKKGINPLDDVTRLWELADVLDKMIITTISDKSVPIIEELVTAYSLILEQILLHNLYAGDHEEVDKKWQGIERSREISKILENNLLFQYQAKNARLIAESLTTPDRSVTETLKAIDELMPIFRLYHVSIDPLLKSNINSLKFWEDLITFAKSTSPLLATKVIEVFGRLKQNFSKPDPRNVEIFSLRPCYLKGGADEKALFSFCESIDSIQQGSQSDDQPDWVYLYRVVDILSEVLFSDSNTGLRVKAFKRIKKLLDFQLPREVQCKIISTLCSLKSDPLFSIAAEELLDAHRAIIEADSKLKQEWRWLNWKRKAYKKIDRELASRHRFKVEIDPRIIDKLNTAVFFENRVISRKELLAKIVKKFQKNSSKTTIQAIRGTPGKGKTTFVIDYLQKYWRDYEFVCWVDARTFEKDLIALAAKKGIAAHLEIDEKLEELKKYLNDHPGWLMIVDNIEESMRDKLVQFFPKNGGHILMTGRSMNENDWPKIWSLDLLSNDESQYLLTHKTCLQSKEDLQQAELVAQKLGHLPLALAQARAYVIGTLGMSFGQYLDLYNNKTIQLSEIMRGVDKENQSAYSTFSVNIDQMRQENQIAGELISFLSFVFPGEIPFSVIEQWQQTYAQSTKLNQLYEAIRALAKYAILEVPPLKDNGSTRERSSTRVYQIHPLTQEISRRLLSDQEWVKYLTQAIIVINDIDGFKHFNPVRKRTHEAFEVIRPHCEALFEIINEDSESLNKLQSLDGKTLEQLQYLVNTVGRYHLSIGENTQLAKKCFNYSLKISELLNIKAKTCSDEVLEDLMNKSKLYEGWSYYLKALLERKELRKLRQNNFQEVEHLFQQAKMTFEAVDPETFDDHCLESNKEKWNKSYILTICRFEELVTHGYDQDHLEEIYQEFEDLSLQFERAAEESWRRFKLRNSLTGSSNDSEGKEEVNIYRFDIPRCLSEQAKIRGLQKNYPEARRLMKLVIKEQKKIYNATPNATFYSTSTSAASYYELADFCYQDGDILSAVKYANKSLNINKNIYKSDNHPRLQKNLVQIKKLQGAS